MSLKVNFVGALVPRRKHTALSVQQQEFPAWEISVKHINRCCRRGEDESHDACGKPGGCISTVKRVKGGAT